MNIALEIITVVCMLAACAGIVHVARDNRRLRLALDRETRQRLAAEKCMLSMQSALTVNVDVEVADA